MAFEQQPRGGILVYRLGSLGDTLIALPAFHKIREQFPNDRITVLTNEAVHAKAAPLATVLEGTGLMDDSISYPIELRTFRQLKRLRDAIAARGFHTVVSLAAARGLSKSIRDWSFFRWCGIRRIIGIPFRSADLRCSRSEGDLYEFEGKRLARRLRTWGQMNLADDHWWDLRLSAAEQGAADELLREGNVASPFLAISIGTKVEVNDWGSPTWWALIRRLAASHLELALVAIGSFEERELSARLLDSWPGPKANLCGRCSPRQSAAVCRRAELFVGHDSGPMHLAAVVGTPCVAIFSARNMPGQWFPRGPHHEVLYHQTPCFGCGLDTCVEHAKACITSISVEEVLEAIERQLHRGRVSNRREPMSLDASSVTHRH